MRPLRLRTTTLLLAVSAHLALPALAQDHGAHHQGMQGPVTSPLAPSAETRTVIELAPGERAFVLAEMRAFLESVEGVVAAIAAGKPDAAAKAATRSGRAAMQGMPPGMMAKLPPEFRMLGMQTHMKFEEIALEAGGMGEPKVIAARLAEALANCTTCHRGYAFSR
jgi:hypothetical protein